MLRRLGADPGLALPKPSLPVRLALLVAGTTLPLIIFAAGLVYNNYKQDRQNATQRVLETVRSIRLVLDSEMQRITGALQVLSLTDALRSGDFIGFRRIAQGFRRDVLDYVNPGEELVDEPFTRMIEAGELLAYRYDGFWEPMDTIKDKQRLDAFAESGKAPWRNAGFILDTPTP